MHATESGRIMKAILVEKLYIATKRKMVSIGEHPVSKFEIDFSPCCCAIHY
jgi:hypothetical protein